jgi:hypothetical protein
MFRLWLNLILVCSVAVILPSCGHDQQLVSIAIQPSAESFGSTSTPVIDDAGASVQLRALGTYTHPPVTKDITSQVTWASNTTSIATVSSTGLLVATGDACGSTLVSATVTTNSSAGNISSQGALVTGYMTGTVVCFTGITLAVDFAGTGSGTISSAPAGLSCASSCNAAFASGTSITITATPNPGSSFGGWADCDAVSGTACTINDLTSARTVVVTFD